VTNQGSFVRDVTFMNDTTVILQPSFTKHVVSAALSNRARLKPKLNNQHKAMKNYNTDLTY
jgi:hypothetical protein